MAKKRNVGGRPPIGKGQPVSVTLYIDPETLDRLETIRGRLNQSSSCISMRLTRRRLSLRMRSVQPTGAPALWGYGGTAARVKGRRFPVVSRFRKWRSALPVNLGRFTATTRAATLFCKGGLRRR